MRKDIFEIIGYSIDFYVLGNFKGSISISEPDRDKCGYEGRKRGVILEEDIKLKNRRILRAGTEVTTELNQINGKVLNRPEFYKGRSNKD